MNELLIKIAKELRTIENVDKVKTYYDIEGNLQVVIKIYNEVEKEIEIYILSGDNLTQATNNKEEIINWFDKIEG